MGTFQNILVLVEQEAFARHFSFSFCFKARWGRGEMQSLRNGCLNKTQVIGVKQSNQKLPFQMLRGAWDWRTRFHFGVPCFKGFLWNWGQHLKKSLYSYQNVSPCPKVRGVRSCLRPSAKLIPVISSALKGVLVQNKVWRKEHAAQLNKMPLHTS